MQTLGMPVDKIRRIVTWEPGDTTATDVLTGDTVSLTQKQLTIMTEEYHFGFVEGKASYRAIFQPDGTCRWTVVPFEKH